MLQITLSGLFLESASTVYAYLLIAEQNRASVVQWSVAPLLPLFHLASKLKNQSPWDLLIRVILSRRACWGHKLPSAYFYSNRKREPSTTLSVVGCY